VEPFCKKNIKPIKDNDALMNSCSRYPLVLSFPISFLFKFTCITNSNQFGFIRIHIGDSLKVAYQTTFKRK